MFYRGFYIQCECVFLKHHEKPQRFQLAANLWHPDYIQAFIRAILHMTLHFISFWVDVSGNPKQLLTLSESSWAELIWMAYAGIRIIPNVESLFLEEYVELSTSKCNTSY